VPEQPTYQVGKPRADEQTDEDRSRAAMGNGYEAEKAPAKTIAQINSEAEVNQS
jgi:hypothetical protein